jgi:uncharacterized integral membrane protein (TIGR00698 family)
MALLTSPRLTPTPDVQPRRKAPLAKHAALLTGLLVAALGYLGATFAHDLVPQVGVLTWAVAFGMIASNLRLIPAVAKPGLGKITKRLLRAGIVLLGFSLSFQSIAALGIGTVGVVVLALVSTILFTSWLGRRVGLSGPRSLIIATGFSICGASAIAAMESTAEADEEDVTAGIAMVTLFGSLAMVLLPLLQGPLGLSDTQFGIWAGASIHEVGQVVAAAGPAGAAVLALAVVVKLTRVLMLAPAVASVSIIKRMKSPAAGKDAKRPPLVPLFVIGFLAAAAVRTAGVLPASLLPHIATVQTAALGAALFGMGASVQLAKLLKGSGPAMLVGAVSTVFISVVSLGGILLVTS